MNRYVILLMALLASLLLGCLDGGESIRTGTQDFSVVLSSNKKCAGVGDTIHLKATVTNKGSQTRVIVLKDVPVFDIIVGNPDNGAKRWSDGKPLNLDLTRLELRPGDSKSIEMDWISAGITSVTAIFIRDLNSQEIPLSTLIVIPPYCPGIGP